MARAKRKLNRMVQVWQWLRDNFYTPYPVYVHIVPFKDAEQKKMWGETWRSGKRIYIRINARLPWSTLLETLLHEWAHAMQVGLAHVDARKHDLQTQHDDAYWIQFGRIYRRWYEGTGPKEASAYPADRQHPGPRRQKGSS